MIISSHRWNKKSWNHDCGSQHQNVVLKTQNNCFRPRGIGVYAVLQAWQLFHWWMSDVLELGCSHVASLMFSCLLQSKLRAKWTQFREAQHSGRYKIKQNSRNPSPKASKYQLWIQECNVCLIKSSKEATTRSKTNVKLRDLDQKVALRGLNWRDPDQQMLQNSTSWAFSSTQLMECPSRENKCWTTKTQLRKNRQNCFQLLSVKCKPK